ncbi:MAG: PAS domain S-box protein, partial [Bacteroidales bacterium]|nr:PAS domain S-box protein [Bacteroidales bacterium]
MGNRSFRNRMIMLAIGAMVLVLMAAFYHFRHQKQYIRLENHSYLQAISELKINQLTQWYQERLSEAKFFSTNAPYNVYINEIIRGNRTFEPDFREALLHIMSGKRYENILLISTQGNVVYSTVAAEKHPVDSVTQSILNQVRLTRQITVSDFYYCPEHERVHIDFISPAFDEHNTLIAFMIFRVEPDDYIMPLIRKWPMPTESAETYIVRRDDDSVAFLSQLRHVSMKPLQMKLSLDRKKLTAVRAVGGFEGIVEGVDYRGEKVLADIRKVPQTSWYMISEIDHREIYRELYKHAVLLTIIILISVLLIGFVTAWIYHYRQRNIYRELFEKQNLLNFREEELRATLYSIGEGVITADKNGLVVNLNPAAAIMTGWSEQEARNRHVREVVRIIDELTHEPVENPVDKVLREGKVVELTNHAVLLSADGREIPVSDNAAPITDREGKILGVVLVISNQTLQRARHRALMESEERYRLLIDNTADAIMMTKSDGTVISVNKAACKMFDMNANEIYAQGKNLLTDTNDPDLPYFFENKTEQGRSTTERVFIRKNGSKFHAELTSAVFSDSSGEVRRSLIIR